MTNHWIDIRNADVVLVIGANPAVNHPIAFKWITDAMENRGAKLVVVDPRQTRTAARADLYAPLRSGTDIAFMGGLIRHILEHDLYARDYVLNYTNASFLIDPGYGFDAGVFSGYDPAARAYATGTWQYQKDELGRPRRDPTLGDPHCALQILKRHYAAYDLATVSRVTGTPVDVLAQAYETIASTGRPDRAGTLLYAMGATQHTYGTQNVRSYAIVQLLLGNIGIAGGGVNAMRGVSNVQGSTDMALLFHILPGYLSSPADGEDTREAYLQKHYLGKNADPASLAWWQNAPKYLTSLLREWYGDAARPENDFAYAWLPKRGGNYSHLSLFEDMHAGAIKGLFVFGQNPAVTGPSVLFERQALGKLDWLVVADLYETETSVFWRRLVEPKDIKTEVFRLPALASMEKEGSISNSGRWVQWRRKGGDGPGEARSDLWMLSRLAAELRRLHERRPGVFPDPIVHLNWPYVDRDGRPDPQRVARAINGYVVATGEQVANFTRLADDGSTACGNWLYSGYCNQAGNNAARRDDRDTHLGMHHDWAWCWPLNRRILYNRASVDPAGQPWDPERPVLHSPRQGDGGAWTWQGDVPDGGMAPMAVALAAGKPGLPFIMRNEGVGCLFAPTGLVDGPLPAHYEPMESPVANALYPATPRNPVVHLYGGASARFGTAERFPIVATTYRMSEHWQGGAMSRNLPWLNELFPELIVMLDHGLARAKGIGDGDRVRIWNDRGEVHAKACVTGRICPLSVGGRDVHTIALPWHWGFGGLSPGNAANRLTPHVGDANTRIPEYKTFLVDVARA
jgi:formate dehydrogenase-N alpha subunit